MSCAICHTRRPRRFCPGVGGDICAVCCGEEREKTVRCPFDCEFLVEARKHERRGIARPEVLPNSDIKLTREVLQDNQPLLLFMGGIVGSAALKTPLAVDSDLRDALEALIRSYRTMASGLVYDTVPQNTVAAGIYRIVRESIDKFRAREAQELGVSRTRDSNILTVLVYLQRLELDENNGRPLGRPFLHRLKEYYHLTQPEATSSSLILP